MQDRVSNRSVDGLKLRRQLLKDTRIVFLTAGYSGKKFIFDRVGVGQGHDGGIIDPACTRELNDACGL